MVWTVVLVLGACGDDGGGDTTVSNDDSCQSLCGCDGCPQTGPSGATSSTGTSAGSGSGSASGATTAAPSTSTTAGPADSSAGGGATGTDTGAAAECVCNPEDPTWVACPDQANCDNPGDECCTADGMRRECVQNDIGVVWLTPVGC